MALPTTLADLFPQADPNHPAVILPEDGSTVTHRWLLNQVEELAATLHGVGLQPGQVVAIVLPNGVEYLYCFLAVARARLIAAPLNPAYKAEEFRFYLEDSGASAVIAPPGEHTVRGVARDLNIPVWTATRKPGELVQLEGLPLKTRQGSPSPRADDTALFLHTSGTTSRPKGVPLTHGNLLASIRNIAAHYRRTPEDVGLVVMPLFHVHGLIGATLSPLFAGGAVVIPPRFSASAFWPAVKAHRVNRYSCSPTIHQVLLSRAD